MNTKSVLQLFGWAFATLTATAQNNFSLYGMTQWGGIDNVGVIFRYTLPSGKDSTLLNFDSANGSAPFGSLIRATDGNLYGATSGGSIDSGKIFRYDLLNNKDTVLLNFNGTNGRSPYANLLQANDGELYGATVLGGSGHWGVVFRYDPINLMDTTLLNFNGGTNPGEVYGSLIQASNGLLYGMTAYGGYYYGVLYCYNTLTKKDSILINFNDTNGAHPYGKLLQASNGVLYGLTYQGGSHDYGVLFRYNLTNGEDSVLFNFDSIHGAGPVGSLIQASNGLLYGMTRAGGTKDSGVLFSYDILTKKDTVLLNLSGSIGTHPQGSLIQVIDGNLYGMTQFGGSKNMGVIFKYNITSGKDSVLLNFDSANGAYPCGDLLEIRDSAVTTRLPTLAEMHNEIKVFPNPNNGIFTINLQNIIGSPLIEIYNVLGEKIYTAKLTLDVTQVNITNQVTGTYLFRIITLEGQLISKGKIVVLQ